MPLQYASQELWLPLLPALRALTLPRPRPPSQVYLVCTNDIANDTAFDASQCLEWTNAISKQPVLVRARRGQHNQPGQSTQEA